MVAVPVVPRSKEPYPKVGENIKYLMEGEWKKGEVTGKGGRATGKNKDYFNVKAREGCTLYMRRAPRQGEVGEGR